MSNALSISRQYYHPYDAVYNMVKTNPFFNEDDWKQHANRGNLRQYLQLLEAADDKLDFDSFSEKFMFGRLNTDERFTAVANELWADKETLKEREETYFDEATRKNATRKFKMTDYDYTNYLLENKLKYEQELIDKENAQARKDALGNWERTIATIGAIGGELVRGVMDMTNDTISLIEGVHDGIDAMLTGKKFSDGFRNAFNTDPITGSADWRVFDNLGWDDAILEWESNYTDLRDIDGNYATLGKYLGGVAYSLGKAVPSMLLNLVTGGIAGKGSAVAEGMAKFATGFYYVGMGAGEFHELASNPYFASVPTYKLMLNSAVRTTVEFLIQKGVSAAFGPTVLDRAIFGEVSKTTGRITALSALKRIAKDFVAEGTEELLQQYSNWVVDSFMAIGEEKFSTTSDWNLQIMMDAFILGGLSTIGHNVFSLIKSGVKDLVNIKKATATSGFNFLASWEFKNVVGELSTEYNSLMKNKSLSAEKKSEALGQMYATARTIADFYGDVGEKRFVEALKMLQTMVDYDAEGKLYAKDEDVKKVAKVIYRAVTDMQVTHVKEDVIKKIVKAKMTKIHSVINKGDDESTYSTEVKKEVTALINQLFNPEKKSPIEKVVLTEDGTTPIVLDKAVYIPIEYVKNAPTADVVKNIEEQTVINAIQQTPSLQPVLKQVKSVLEDLTNKKDIDMNEVIFRLFYDISFQKILISVANADVIQLVASLQKLEAEATSNIVTSDVYRKRVDDMLTKLKMNLFQYAQNQQVMSLAEIQEILTPAQFAKLRELRTNRDFANKVIAGNEKLTDQELTMLKTRVNSMATTAKAKTEILEGLQSKTKAARQSAFARMENFYRNVYNSPYDNKTYLKTNSLSNAVFNGWMEGRDLTLRTLTDISKLTIEERTELRNTYGDESETSLIKYYQQKFNEHNSMFTFAYDKGIVVVYKLIANPTPGYSAYRAARDEIVKGTDIDSRRFTVVRTGSDKILDSVLSKDVDKMSKQYIGIKNVIYNPELLADEIKSEIIKNYGALDSESTFLYLRQKFLKDTGTITIVLMQNGQIMFADIRPMLQVLTKPDVEIPDVNVSPRKKFEKDGGQIELKSELRTEVYQKIASERDYLDTLTGEYDNVITVENAEKALGRKLTIDDFNMEEQHSKNVNLANPVVRSLFNIKGDWIVEYDGSGNIELFDTKGQAKEAAKKSGNASIYYVRKNAENEHSEFNKNVFKTKNKSLGEISDILDIKKFVKSEYLFGRLKTINLRLGDRTEYDAVSNTITIDKNSAANPAYFRFSLLHEFQHAMQLETGMNGGLPVNFMAQMNKVDRLKLTKEVILHKPELFKGVDENSEEAMFIAQQFLYDTSGESDAYGVSANNTIVDFYPTLVSRLGNSVELTTPWGTTWSLDGSIQSLELNASNKKIFDDIDDLAMSMLVPYSSTKIAKGFILPSGNIGFLTGNDIHPQLMDDVVKYSDNYLAAAAYMTDAIQITNDVQTTDAEGRRIAKFGDDKPGIGMYSIRMLGHRNKQQETALINFLNKIISSRYDVELADAHGWTITNLRNVVSDWEPTGWDLLEQYEKDRSRDRAARGADTKDTYNHTQKFFGEGYNEVHDLYTDEYLTEDFSKDAKMGLITLDGFVGFNSKTSNSFELAAMVDNDTEYKDMALRYANGSIRIELSKDEITIRMPFYVITNLQKDAFTDTMIKLKRDGRRITVRFALNIKPLVFDENFLTMTQFADHVIQIMESSTGYDVNQIKYAYKAIRDTMSMDQPGDPKPRRYVSQKQATGTNLEYFVKKNRQLQLSPATQDFIVNADSSLLDRELWDMIGGENKGTLTETKVMQYLRTAENMDAYTFKLIKDAFFPDSPIETFEQLEYLIHRDVADYYALRNILVENGATNEQLNTIISHSKFKEILDKLARIPELKKKFDQIVARYNTFRGNYLDVDYNNMKIAFMKYFDGSVNSASAVAAIGKIIAIKGWKTAGHYKTESLSKEIKGDMTYEDVLEDPNAQDALEQLNTESGRTDKENDVLTYIYEKMYAKIQEKGLKPTVKQLNAEMQKWRQKVEDLSDNDLEQMHAKYILANVSGVTLSDEALESKAKIVRPRVNVAANIKRTATVIKSLVAPADKKRFLSVNNDLFNDDLKLKEELYVGKSKPELLELEDKLKLVRKDVKAKVYQAKSSMSYKQKYEKTVKQLRAEREKRFELQQQKRDKAAKQVKVTYVTVSDYTFKVGGDVEMPAELKAILETTFEKFVKTDVTYLTKPGEKHMQMNLVSFIEQNAQRLGALDTQEVLEILDYYQNTFLQGDLIETDSPSYIKYRTFRTYMLGYIYEQARYGKWQLTDAQFAEISKILETSVSAAATELAAFKSILPMINPEKIIIQSMAREADIEFKEQYVNELTMALRSKNIADIKEATRKMYESGLRSHKGSKKSFFDKAWKFQSMMMLSSPGTAIRNAMSNVLLTVGNNASAAIGNTFFKKHLKNQYVMHKTNVDPKIVKFIQESFIDNGFLELTKDGLNRYDPISSKNKVGGTILTDMIKNAIKSKIFNDTAFDSEPLRQARAFIYKMLSDDKWIDKRAIQYFGKMLQENGTYLAEGKETYEMFAEAYMLASWEYMHKPNVFNKMEYAIKQKSSPAVYYMYKQLLPFASQSWNWFMEGLKYTPVGLVMAIHNYNHLEQVVSDMETKREKGERIPSNRFAEYITKQNLGKGIIGSIGMGIGLLLGGFGVARVDEEDDKVKLWVGDLAVDISGLFGTQSIFLGIAMTNPRKGDWQKYLYDVMDTLFLDSTLQDLFNTFRYSDGIGEWLINQPGDMLARYIPNALKAFNSLLYNHKIQYSSGIMNGFERFLVTSIPGFAYAMPKRVDIYTGEIQTKYSIPFLFEFVNRLSPLDFAHYKVTELEKQAIMLGISKSTLTGKYKDVDSFKDKDVQKLNEYYGKLNNKALQTLFDGVEKYRVQTSDGTYKELTYKQMTVEQQKTVAERLMNANAKYAKIIVYTNNGGKYYATESEFLELKKLGITTNVYRESKMNKGFK